MATIQSSKAAQVARRERVASLKADGHTITEIAQTLASEIVNPRTSKPYSMRTVREDFVSAVSASAGDTGSAGARKPVREMIGRGYGNGYGFDGYDTLWDSISIANTYSRVTSVDNTRPDVLFWDKLRNCKAEGYEISGLFCNAISETLAAYVLGDLPTYTLLESGDPNNPNDRRTYTNRQIVRWLTVNHAVLIRMLIDCYALGDQFVFVNSDASLSVPSPDTVKIAWSPIEPYRPEMVTVTQRFKGVTVEYIYTASERIVRFKEGGKVTREEVYANLTGRIPLVHFANDRRTNEQYGRPIYEAILPLLATYNDVLVRSVDGVRLLSNPIPVFEGLENVQATVDSMSPSTPESYLDEDGVETDRAVVKFDTNGAIFLGKGGHAAILSPSVGFTKDAHDTLNKLIEQIRYNVHFPQFLLGMLSGDAKAALEAQAPAFEKYVALRRLLFDGQGRDDDYDAFPLGGMYELIDLMLQTKSLTDPKIVVEAVNASWMPISAADDQVTMQKVVFANAQGVLRQETMLRKLKLVPDAAREVEMARQELATRQTPEDQFMTTLNTLSHTQNDLTKQDPNANRPNRNPIEPDDPAGGNPKPYTERKPASEMGASAAIDANAIPVGVDAQSAITIVKPRRKRRRSKKAKVAAIVTAVNGNGAHADAA